MAPIQALQVVEVFRMIAAYRNLLNFIKVQISSKLKLNQMFRGQSLLSMIFLSTLLGSLPANIFAYSVFITPSNRCDILKRKGPLFMLRSYFQVKAETSDQNSFEWTAKP